MRYNDVWIVPHVMFSTRSNWDVRPNALSTALAEARQHGREVLDLTLSNPTECGFAFEEARIVAAFANSQSLHYEPNPFGLRSARAAVANYYVQRSESVSPDDLILTPGTSEAYSFLFKILCNPGEEVLVPAPSYPLFSYLADICDVRLIPYSLVYEAGWQIDFASLQQAITSTTRAVIVVHPNNPTGHFTEDREANQLKSLCSANNLALIADEVFLDFAWNGTQRKSFAANTSCLTFVLNGLSKICGLPQMKLAWIAVSGPPAQKQAALERLEVISDSYLSVSTPVQLAAPTLLETRQSFQNQLLARVHVNLSELRRQLVTAKSCDLLQSQGGWSAVLRVPAIQSDDALALEILQTHSVYVHPGHFYDFPQNGFLVVSLIVPEKVFSEGVPRILSSVQK